MLGNTYADDNGLTTGSSFSLDGISVTVVGVFSTGSNFGENTVILPYRAAQSIFGASGPTLLSVTGASTASVGSLVSEIQGELGSSYSITALGQNGSSPSENAINSILSSSQLEEYVVLAVGAAIMVLVRILLTSQRTMEIGLLKASGFSEGRILSQLLTESTLPSVAGWPVALVINVWLGPTIAPEVLGVEAKGQDEDSFPSLAAGACSPTPSSSRPATSGTLTLPEGSLSGTCPWACAAERFSVS